MRYDYQLHREAIPVAAYLRLRQEVGWWEVDESIVERSLAESLFSVFIKDKDGAVVACGRLIGDPMYMYVQDMIVSQPWRGRGLGRLLMGEILQQAERLAGKGSYLGLMCARGVEGFYAKFGFERRPADGPGMQRVFR